MPKQVFRTKITMIKDDVNTSFFQSLPGIEKVKADWKSQGRILNYYGVNSEDNKTRIYICDFASEADRLEFRTLIEVDEAMEELMHHNSDNNIITYFEESLIETNDYD